MSKSDTIATSQVDRAQKVHDLANILLNVLCESQADYVCAYNALSQTSAAIMLDRLIQNGPDVSRDLLQAELAHFGKLQVAHVEHLLNNEALIKELKNSHS